MTIYRYPHLPLASWPAAMRPGLIPGIANLRGFNAGAAVLSNLRWSATVGYHAGASFSSAEIYLFLPWSSTGRCAPQVIVQSPASASMSGVAVRTMTAGSTYTQWTGTSTGTIANPTDLTGASSGFWSPRQRNYPGNTTYALITNGASRLCVYGLTGSGPLGISVIGYPDQQFVTSATSGVCGWRNDGRYCPTWPYYDLYPLPAGWARTIEAELEVGEAMPIILGVLPGHASGVTCYQYPWVSGTIQRVMSRQIPLAEPLRAKALYVAIQLPASSGVPALEFTVGDQRIASWQTVYSSGYYKVLKARLDSAAYFSWTTVGGVPIVNVRCTYYYGVDSSYAQAMTAWISEDFDL